DLGLPGAVENLPGRRRLELHPGLPSPSLAYPGSSFCDKGTEAIVSLPPVSSSASSTIPGDSMKMQFHGQTSSQARHRMQLSGSSMRCFGDLTPWESHAGSTVSTT